jgi:hypothetical protein
VCGEFQISPEFPRLRIDTIVYAPSASDHNRFAARSPGGLRAVVAESVLAKHQLLILNRLRRRAPESPRPGSVHNWILFSMD